MKDMWSQRNFTLIHGKFVIQFDQYMLGFVYWEYLWEQLGHTLIYFSTNIQVQTNSDSLGEYQFQKTSYILKSKPKIYNILNHKD